MCASWLEIRRAPWESTRRARIPSTAANLREPPGLCPPAALDFRLAHYHIILQTRSFGWTGRIPACASAAGATPLLRRALSRESAALRACGVIAEFPSGLDISQVRNGASPSKVGGRCPGTCRRRDQAPRAIKSVVRDAGFSVGPVEPAKRLCALPGEETTGGRFPAVTRLARVSGATILGPAARGAAWMGAQLGSARGVEQLTGFRRAESATYPPSIVPPRALHTLNSDAPITGRASRATS